MNKKKKKSLAKPTTPASPRSSSGTAVLGKVIPELVICGTTGVTDQDALHIANSISKTILMKFQMDLLHEAGLIGAPDEDD